MQTFAQQDPVFSMFFLYVAQNILFFLVVFFRSELVTQVAIELAFRRVVLHSILLQHMLLVLYLCAHVSACLG